MCLLLSVARSLLWVLVATRCGPYPHTDDGVGVRRILHELRSRAIENLNEQFKRTFRTPLEPVDSIVVII